MSQGSTTTRPAGETPRRIEYLALGELEGTPGNPKLHDLDALKASIQRHGLAEVPLRDDRTGRIVAGHGRIDELRAQLLAGESPPDGVRLRADGEWLVPVLVGWRSKSDADAKHYVIASNQTTRAGGWDVGLFEAMAADALQSAEDLLAAGFGDRTIDEVLASLRAEVGAFVVDPEAGLPDLPDPTDGAAMKTMSFLLTADHFDEVNAALDAAIAAGDGEGCDGSERANALYALLARGTAP